MLFHTKAELAAYFWEHPDLTELYIDTCLAVTIVGSGNNACVLHYTTNREQIQDDHLVLIDAACEL